MTIDATIEMFAEAEEGSRELDARMAVELGVNPQYEGDGIYGCPRYTTNLQHAVEAVPSGYWWEASRCGGQAQGMGLYVWKIWTVNADATERYDYTGMATTPQLALCLAILKVHKVITNG